MPGDAELVRAARGGDAASLGALLEHHRAEMHAVALSVLGWGPEAEDAVQDAMLTALRRLGELRDPAAAGAWLKAVTRNAARMRLRSAGREIPLTEHADGRPSPERTPEEVLDGHALSDWVHASLEMLSEPLQLPVMLRYFTEASSYQQIAAVCGVPVGTVRSRLSEARRKLTATLLESVAAAHDDASALAARRHAEVEHLITSAPRGEFPRALAALAVPDLHLTGPQGQHGQGTDLLVRIMDSDLEAGVRQHLVRVTASRRLTILAL